MARAPIARMSYEAYLTQEAKGEQRHEFLDDDVFAVARTAPEHAAIAAAMIAELGAALRGRPCRVFASSVRIKVAATGLTTYADASVVCERLQTDSIDRNAVTNPVLLVEVLSEDSEAYDRGAKAAHYRQIESLREYVLLSGHEPVVEVWRRNARQRFELVEARLGDQFELASVGVTLDVAAIYSGSLARADA